MVTNVLPPLDPAALPAGIRARFVEGVNGLRMHVLEAGEAGPDRPLILLVHGFPEIAYSWRKVMPALAAAGYHVVAPTSGATAAPRTRRSPSRTTSRPTACTTISSTCCA